MKTPHTELLRQYLEFEDDGANAIAFKEAGDVVVDFVARGEKYAWYEAFLRPIGFLYRHYLELELKYWIKELGDGSSEQVGCVLKQHNLKDLWYVLKPLIHPFCESQEDKEMLSEVEEVVLIFDKYDPTGQHFRYTRTIQNTNTLKNLPHKIDVNDVKGLIGRVSSFFDGLGGVVGPW